MWDLISYGAWAISALIIIWMVFDWIKIDSTYSEEVLTSSIEGELETSTVDHSVGGAKNG